MFNLTQNAKLKKFCEQASNKNPFTPDALLLHQQEYHFLFVTDEMQRRHRKAFNKGEGYPIFLSQGFAGPNLVMYKRKLLHRSYSVVLEEPKQKKKNEFVDLSTTKKTAYYLKDNNKSGYVRGELYLVTPQDLINIDNYRNSSVQSKNTTRQLFIRKKMTIQIFVKKVVWFKDRSMAEKILDVRLQKSRSTVDRVYTIKAWMYVGYPGFWRKQLDGGYLFAPVKTYLPKRDKLDGNKYYQFTLGEYSE